MRYSGNYYIMNTLDDGSGPRLYVAGDFQWIGTVQTGNVACWNGGAWEGVGSLVGLSPPRDIVSLEHGGGAWIYVADVYWLNGQIAGRVIRWNGQTWSPLPGSGIANIGINAVHKLAVFDDGRGPALYIAGLFTEAGGIPVRNVVRFDGTAYEPLGVGIGTWINDMTVFNDGRGESLFFVGTFSSAGGGAGLGGMAQWVGCPNCYANCDNSSGAPAVTVADFTCFLQKYVARDPYANCDVSTTMPAINVADFTCFLQRYAAGCP